MNGLCSCDAAGIANAKHRGGVSPLYEGTPKGYPNGVGVCNAMVHVRVCAALKALVAGPHQSVVKIEIMVNLKFIFSW